MVVGGRCPREHGNGLGSQVVLGVERLARARDITRSRAQLTDNFFLAIDYKPTAISRFPEKLCRYENLATAGVEIVPKRCFTRKLDKEWQLPPTSWTPHRQGEARTPR